MARSALIDPLVFHNFKVFQDNIICKHDDQMLTKLEKDSQRRMFVQMHLNGLNLFGEGWAQAQHLTLTQWTHMSNCFQGINASAA